jgi:hypothetical protein
MAWIDFTAAVLTACGHQQANCEDWEFAALANNSQDKALSYFHVIH